MLFICGVVESGVLVVEVVWMEFCNVKGRVSERKWKRKKGNICICTFIIASDVLTSDFMIRIIQRKALKK